MAEEPSQDRAAGQVGSVPGGTRTFAEGDAHHPAPRIWVLACGAWMALCWLAIPIAILTGAWLLIPVAIVGSTPVAWYWRIKYVRAKQMSFGRSLASVAIYMYPMRDAVAELRASKGAGPGARI